MLNEVARAVRWSAAVLGEAGPEGWPDLAEVGREGRAVVREAALRDPRLFAPAEFDPAALDAAQAAHFTDPRGWRAIGADCYAALGAGGIPMAALPWGRGGGRRWLAQVGGIGLGFHASAEEAARQAAAAHDDWFGAEGAPGG